MTPEEHVKLFYPKAYTTYNGALRVTEVWSSPSGGIFLGQAAGRWTAEPAAWDDAKRRLWETVCRKGEGSSYLVVKRARWIDKCEKCDPTKDRVLALSKIANIYFRKHFLGQDVTEQEIKNSVHVDCLAEEFHKVLLTETSEVNGAD